MSLSLSSAPILDIISISICITHIACLLILSPIIIQLENLPLSSLTSSASYLLFHDLLNCLLAFLLDYCGRIFNIPFPFCSHKYPSLTTPHNKMLTSRSQKHVHLLVTTFCYSAKKFVEGIKLRILRGGYYF